MCCRFVLQVTCVILSCIWSFGFWVLPLAGFTEWVLVVYERRFVLTCDLTFVWLLD